MESCKRGYNKWTLRKRNYAAAVTQEDHPDIVLLTEFLTTYRTLAGIASCVTLKTGIKERKLKVVISTDIMTEDDMEITIDQLKDIAITLICICIGYHIVKNMMREWKSTKYRDPIIIVNSYFKVKQAVLCIDCDTVFSREMFVQCPRCASKSLYAISYSFEKEPIWKHTIQKPEGVTLQ